MSAELSALADELERMAAEEWDRVLLRREGLQGRSGGSSYWDGRQAAFREVVEALRSRAGLPVIQPICSGGPR